MLGYFVKFRVIYLGNIWEEIAFLKVVGFEDLMYFYN